MLLGHYNFYTFPLLVFSLFTTVVMGIVMVSSWIENTAEWCELKNYVNVRWNFVFFHLIMLAAFLYTLSLFSTWKRIFYVPLHNLYYLSLP